MAVLTGPVYVQNPNPQTLRYGLFTVAVGPLDMPDHAGDGGVTWLSNSCGQATGYEVNCIDSLGEKSGFGDSISVAKATPFTVTAGYECGPVGISEAERRRFALEKLQATEQAAVEDIFSRGTFGQSPSLANNTPAATDVGPAVDIVEAFSQLEDAFYSTYGYPGTIHLPHVASSFAEAAEVMSMQQRLWRTAASSVVSIGNYAGLSPSGASPGADETWVYITPPVAIWRASTPFISPIEGALDRGNNEMTTFAEREYVVAYEPCPVYATRVTLSGGS